MGLDGLTQMAALGRGGTLGPTERAALLLALAFLWWGVVRYSVRRLADWLDLARLDPPRRRLARMLLNAALWFGLAELTFGVLDIPSLVVTLGGGLALVLMGLAGTLTPVLSDLACGWLLRSDGDLRPGVRIRFRQVEGEVVSLAWRKVKLKDARGRIYVVPSRLLDQELFVLLPPLATPPPAATRGVRPRRRDGAGPV